MKVICANADCRCEYVPTRHMVSRDIEDRPDIKDIGFVCPRCKQFNHTHYDSLKLAALRQRVHAALWVYKRNKQLRAYNAYKRIQEEFTKAFNELNPPGPPMRPARWQNQEGAGTLEDEHEPARQNQDH